MHNVRFYGSAAAGAGLRGQNAQLVHGRRVKPGRQALPFHYVQRRQHMEQNQLRSLAGRDLTGKRRARARGLSE